MASALTTWQGQPQVRRFSVWGLSVTVSVTDWSKSLVAIATRGDRQEFALLFAYFAPRLKSFFLRLGAGAGAAEELAQETMLVVWRKAGQFDPQRAAASTWIFTIARNLRIDLKRKERDPALLAEFFESAPTPMPSDHIVSAEREGAVRRALTVLSREQGEAIRLSFFEDRPHAEIAKMLDIPLGTVKSRLRLAIARLRALIEEVQ